MAKPGYKQYNVPDEVDGQLLAIAEELAPGSGMKPIQVIKALITEHYDKVVA